MGRRRASTRARRAVPRCRPAASPRSSSAVLLLGAFASARAEAATRRAARKRPSPGCARSQNEDGGYGEKPGAESGQSMTGWAMLGLRGRGRQPAGRHQRQGQSAGRISAGRNRRQCRARGTWRGRSSRSRAPGSNRANSAVATWSRRCWRNDGRTAPTKTGRTRPPTPCWRCARPGSPTSPTRSNGCAKSQNEDGGWGDVPGSPSDADGTGAVLQALSPSSKAAQRAVGYLRQMQQPGGG